MDCASAIAQFYRSTSRKIPAKYLSNLPKYYSVKGLAHMRSPRAAPRFATVHGEFQSAVFGQLSCTIGWTPIGAQQRQEWSARVLVAQNCTGIVRDHMRSRRNDLHIHDPNLRWRIQVFKDRPKPANVRTAFVKNIGAHDDGMDPARHVCLCVRTNSSRTIRL